MPARTPVDAVVPARRHLGDRAVEPDDHQPREPVLVAAQRDRVRRGRPRERALARTPRRLGVVVRLDEQRAARRVPPIELAARARSTSRSRRTRTRAHARRARSGAGRPTRAGRRRRPRGAPTWRSTSTIRDAVHDIAARSHSCQATQRPSAETAGSHAKSARDQRCGQARASAQVSATSRASSRSHAKRIRPSGPAVGAAALTVPGHDRRRTTGDGHHHERAGPGHDRDPLVVDPAPHPAPVRADAAEREVAGDGHGRPRAVGGRDPELGDAVGRLEPAQPGAAGREPGLGHHPGARHRERRNPCIHRGEPSRAPASPGSPREAHGVGSPASWRPPPDPRIPPRRLADLPGEPPLWRPGRLHPLHRPRGHRARPPRRGPLGPAVPRARRSAGPREDPEHGPLPLGQPVPGAVAVGVPRPRRPRRVRAHVHGRVPRAVGVHAAGPHVAAGPPRRLRPRPRQPVVRQRDARDDGRRLADLRHPPPPHHRGPRPRARAREERLPALQPPALVRVPQHADEGRAPGAAPRDRERELAQGHRRPDGRRPRPAEDRARSASTRTCSVRSTTSRASRAGCSSPRRRTSRSRDSCRCSRRSPRCAPSATTCTSW